MLAEEDQMSLLATAKTQCLQMLQSAIRTCDPKAQLTDGQTGAAVSFDGGGGGGGCVSLEGRLAGLASALERSRAIGLDAGQVAEVGTGAVKHAEVLLARMGLEAKVRAQLKAAVATADVGTLEKALVQATTHSVMCAATKAARAMHR